MTSPGEAGGSPAGPRAGGFQTGELLAQGRYRVGRELNRGGAAVVYEGLDLQAAPPAAVALKCHDLRHAERQALERLKREILYAKEMAHANVVRLLNVFVDNECLVLVLELVRGSDLLEVINRRGGRLGEPEARLYFQQLLSGVLGLHRSNLAHRDIKPENCMIDLQTNTLKVIDMGLSKHLTSARTLGVGTPDYMAPELISFGLPHGAGGVGYNASAADVWSMGATLYLMTVGVYPFEDQRNPRDMCATLKNVLAGRYRPLRPGLLSAECEDLLGRMLVPRPADRITLAEVAQHPWVARVDHPAPAAP